MLNLLLLRSLLGRLQTMESRLMRTLDEVLDNVRAERTQIASLIALTRGLKQQVRDITSGKLSEADQAKVDAIFDEVETAKNDAIAAINANANGDAIAAINANGDAPTAETSGQQT